ncbi:MAG: hypothetical protein ACTSU7_00125 [Candidatus Heimdallarchaeaceae archaeon]
METVKVEIRLMKYDELMSSAQDKAYEEHLNFLESSNYDFDAKEDEEMIFNFLESTEEEIREYVEDSIRINEYLFFQSGEIANCTTYTGKHEKAGITEFIFQDKVYTI